MERNGSSAGGLVDSGPPDEGGQEHRVPLAPRCVELPKQDKLLGAGSEFLFPGRSGKKPMSNTLEICEFALAHIVKDKTEAAYRRGDLFEKGRELMDTPARFVEGTPATFILLKPVRNNG